MRKQGPKRIIGRLSMHFDGYGFVVSEQKGDPDLFIPAPHIGNALHKDLVEVESKRGRGGKIEGRIVKIIERGITQLVGRFELRGKGGIVITDDFRVGRRVYITKGKELGSKHGEMVIAKITEYPTDSTPLEGEVIKNIGKRNTDAVELDILKARHNLPQEFEQEVLDEAKTRVEEFYHMDEKGRKDHTNLPFITIDGEDAKDFDDAVYAEAQNASNIRVWVSIADVSEFVKPGSVVDSEAAKRATSIYLPGTCIPMLPTDLSNNICSLIAGENRYCLTAEFSINSDGRITKPKFYKNIIKSKYRMTYREANSYLSDNVQLEAEEGVLKSLDNLNKAAHFFRRARKKRGSIDFDLPEPEINLDLQGVPEDIVKAERNIAHLLIEDLMIAANEVVAEYLTNKKYACVYRIHDAPSPDKLVELKMLMKYLGYKVTLPENPTPKELSKVVKMVRNKPEEKLVNMMLLRSLAQAVYGTTNIGHYGLASKCYCHFTSPIRRYPDLMIHRLLGDALGYERYKKGRDQKYLKGQAKHSTNMERAAMEAERESIKLYAALFMRDKVGDIYDGIVSHVNKKGLFVELLDYFVEGLIEPQFLLHEKYTFDQRNYSYVGKKSGNSIHIGDKVKVLVRDVSIEDRRIYFEPAENAQYKEKH